MSAAVYVNPNKYGGNPYSETPYYQGPGPASTQLPPRLITTPYDDVRKPGPASSNLEDLKVRKGGKFYKNHPCLIAVAVFLGLALVAAVIALGVVLATTDKGESDDEDAVTTESPDSSPPPGTVPLEAELLLSDWQFHDELTDPTSDLYKAYQAKLCDKAVSSTVQTQWPARQCDVTSFTEGSVRAIIRIYVNNQNSNEDADVRSGVEDILVEVFSSDEQFGTIAITVEVNRCVGNGNGGCAQTCTGMDPGSGGPVCSCRDGYTLHNNNKDCNNIDECEVSSPCSDYCTDTDGSFTCSCDPGYVLSSDGLTCDDVDECLVQNGGCGGDCSNQNGTFECVCPAGFRLGTDGSHCENIDDCADSPCENGGRCMDMVDSYYCLCEDTGYVGLHCQTDMDECMAGTSGCSQKCVNLPGAFECQCNPGYVLDTDDSVTCHNLDNCALQPCQNEGTCVDREDYYVCSCPASHTGFNCETERSVPGDAVCYPDTCENDGVCIEVETALGFTCDCSQDYSGATCQEPVVACDNSLCHNGGSCRRRGAQIVCRCPPGIFGDTCQIDADECQVQSGDTSNACEQLCTNTLGSYVCSCRDGWNLDTDGTSCIEIDECSSSPCLNGGSCVEQENGYSCLCDEMFGGANCQDEIGQGYCADEPCGKGGTCVPVTDYYVCVCHANFTGLRCETELMSSVNECIEDPDPCENDGVCSDLPVGYRCSCPRGFSGATCSHDVDECIETSVNTCQHLCTNTRGSFVCSCRPGYTLASDGVSCVDVDECSSRTCDFCTNTEGSDYCYCPGNMFMTPYEGYCFNMTVILDTGSSNMYTTTPGAISNVCYANLTARHTSSIVKELGPNWNTTVAMDVQIGWFHENGTAVPSDPSGPFYSISYSFLGVKAAVLSGSWEQPGHLRFVCQANYSGQVAFSALDIDILEACNEFTCYNRRCIPGNSTCDDRNDCGDFSDEQDVCSDWPGRDDNSTAIPEPPHTSVAQPNQTYPTYPTYHTYPTATYPTYHTYPTDHTYPDTTNTPTGYYCHDGYMCENYECVSYDARCDKYTDCADGSDERYCDCEGFRCRDGHCLVHADYECDGIPDCRDHSDELYCPSKMNCIVQVSVTVVSK